MSAPLFLPVKTGKSPTPPRTTSVGKPLTKLNPAVYYLVLSWLGQEAVKVVRFALPIGEILSFIAQQQTSAVRRRELLRRAGAPWTALPKSLHVASARVGRRWVRVYDLKPRRA